MATWAPSASPGEIQRLTEAREAAQGHAGHVEYVCGRGSPEARYATHAARQAGQELYAATHPAGPYSVRDGQIETERELEAG